MSELHDIPKVPSVSPSYWCKLSLRFHLVLMVLNKVLE